MHVIKLFSLKFEPAGISQAKLMITLQFFFPIFELGDITKYLTTGPTENFA